MDTFWKIAAYSVDHLFFYILTIWNYNYFQFWFWGFWLRQFLFTFSCPWVSKKSMYNLVSTLRVRPAFFNGSSSFLADKKDNHKNWDEFEFRIDSIDDCVVSCPWVSEKLMYNLFCTLAPSFLIGFSSFLQEMRITIKSRMTSKFHPVDHGQWS